ncbi:MAG TPA: phosphoesterase, partial [Oxalobacteraceae bacterium]|nr:phosphoesterase [Oxalobacteraceae bacterium]
MPIKGVVTSTAYRSGSATDPTILAGYYQGALVCVDLNNNGKCDPDEKPAVTDHTGHFTLAVPALHSANLPVSAMMASHIIADIGTRAINTATRTWVGQRNVFRAPWGQVEEHHGNLVISPLSAEVARMMEANDASFESAKQNLAARMSVPAGTVLEDVNTVGPRATMKAMLAESNGLSNRFAYAVTKLDRGDLYPDALAVPGGDPRLNGKVGVTPETATTTDTRKPITFRQSQQAAFNIEGIPRYDHIFVVMLENKAT